MAKIQELIEEIQEENITYMKRIGEEKRNVMGRKAYKIGEEKCIKQVKKSVSENVIELKDHIDTDNEKRESSSLLKEKRKEKREEKRKENTNINNKKFRWTPSQGGFSDWSK